jgi:hypothetical protein
MAVMNLFYLFPYLTEAGLHLFLELIAQPNTTLHFRYILHSIFNSKKFLENIDEIWLKKWFLLNCMSNFQTPLNASILSNSFVVNNCRMFVILIYILCIFSLYSRLICYFGCNSIDDDTSIKPQQCCFSTKYSDIISW